jgi:hypothetical protein
VIALLRLAGEAYLPFLRANAEAIDEGRDMLRVQLLDGELAQAPFRYQAKCYRALRCAYAALDAEARARARPPSKRAAAWRTSQSAAAKRRNVVLSACNWLLEVFPRVSESGHVSSENRGLTVPSSGRERLNHQSNATYKPSIALQKIAAYAYKSG